MTIAEKSITTRTPAEPPGQLYLARNVLRCAIYIRVSTAEQRMEGWSLDAQEAGLRAEAEKKGWKVVGIYADEGKSARKRLKDRKAIHRLVEDVKAGLVDVIIFKELDRWFRSISDFYKIQDVLDQYGVEWYSQQQPSLEMRTKEGRLQVNVLLSVGQNETDATSDRIKYTHKYLRSQKRWTSGKSNLPRGYTLDEDQHVIIDPEQEPFVRALIDNFYRTGSIRGSMLETNAQFEDQYIHYNNLTTLLRNPMLCGEYKEEEGFVEEPYMTREEFQRMQSLMVRNARSGPGEFYIFAGLLFCSTCGRSMSGSATKRPKKTYKHYRCSHAKKEHTCTETRIYNEERLEKELMAYVREAVADKIATVKSVKQAQKKKKPRKNNRASIEKQLDKLEDLYISDDRMTKEKYEAKKAAILAKLVDDEPEVKLPELADLEKIQALFDSDVEDLYQTFTLEERREFWRGILRSVTIKDAQIESVDFIE